MAADDPTDVEFDADSSGAARRNRRFNRPSRPVSTAPAGGATPQLPSRRTDQSPHRRQLTELEDDVLSRGNGFRSRASRAKPLVVDCPQPGTTGDANHAMQSMVTDALGRLAVEHRAVIYRSYYLRWPVSRIAADLAISEDTVTARLHNGLQAFRSLLDEMGVTT